MYNNITAESLQVVDTIYSACSVEASPFHPRLFACGTYQLAETFVDPFVEKAATLEDALEGLTVKEGDESDSDDEDVATPAAEKKPQERMGRCLLYEVDKEGSSL